MNSGKCARGDQSDVMFKELRVRSVKAAAFVSASKLFPVFIEAKSEELQHWRIFCVEFGGIRYYVTTRVAGR